MPLVRGVGNCETTVINFFPVSRLLSLPPQLAVGVGNIRTNSCGLGSLFPSRNFSLRFFPEAVGVPIHTPFSARLSGNSTLRRDLSLLRSATSSPASSLWRLHLSMTWGPVNGSPCLGRCKPSAWGSCASIQMRFRTCGAPTSSAPSTSHSASYPISARSPRTLASPLPTSRGEFSRNANFGRTSLIIRCISRQSPERAPSMPAPFPAAEMSWHGKPPDTTSTRPRHGRPSKVHTSSQTGKGGSRPSFWRASSTLAG